MVKAHLLTDSFTDNATDTTKWVAFGTVQEVNARVECPPAANSTNNYSGYTSAGKYDLTGSEVRIELLQTLNAAPGAASYLVVEQDGSNRVLISVENGLIRAVQHVGARSWRWARPPTPPRCIAGSASGRARG